MPLSEFELIRRYFRDCGTRRDDVVIGVGDDAAVTRVPAGCELVTTVDVLVAGVHFAAGAPPGEIGHRCLAVNLSDLAAMGAEPAWCTLALTLPEADPAWLQAFSGGFSELAQRFGVQLVGGDTARGPLQAAVQAMGWVPAGAALTRGGARPGDAIWVTGTLGDAALALREGPGAAGAGRLHRPEPRVSAGLGLRGLASACIDVSDGLAADLGHVLSASAAGAAVELASLPASAALATLDEGDRWSLQVSGGDDYELCFTTPEDAQQRVRILAAELQLPVTRIGTVEAQDGLRFRRGDGSRWAPETRGYEHFSGGA